MIKLKQSLRGLTPNWKVLPWVKYYQAASCAMEKLFMKGSVAAADFIVAFCYCCSVVSDSATPWTAARQASLSFAIFWSLLKLMSIESVMPSNHLILCRPFLLLPSFFPSTRAFSSESALCIRWPKYWNSASVLPMNIQDSVHLLSNVSLRPHEP